MGCRWCCCCSNLVAAWILAFFTLIGCGSALLAVIFYAPSRDLVAIVYNSVLEGLGESVDGIVNNSDSAETLARRAQDEALRLFQSLDETSESGSHWLTTTPMIVLFVSIGLELILPLALCCKSRLLLLLYALIKLVSALVGSVAAFLFVRGQDGLRRSLDLSEDLLYWSVAQVPADVRERTGIAAEVDAQMRAMRDQARPLSTLENLAQCAFGFLISVWLVAIVMGARRELKERKENHYDGHFYFNDDSEPVKYG